jgi:hypothetical protein
LTISADIGLPLIERTGALVRVLARRAVVFLGAAERLTAEAAVRFLVATAFLTTFFGAAFLTTFFGAALALVVVALVATAFFGATRFAAGLVETLTVRLGAALVLRTADLVEDVVAFFGAAARLAAGFVVVFRAVVVRVAVFRTLVLLTVALRAVAF